MVTGATYMLIETKNQTGTATTNKTHITPKSENLPGVKSVIEATKPSFVVQHRLTKIMSTSFDHTTKYSNGNIQMSSASSVASVASVRHVKVRRCKTGLSATQSIPMPQEAYEVLEEDDPNVTVRLATTACSPISTITSITSSSYEDVMDIETLVSNTSAALKEGITPVLIEDCTGGTYYLRSPTRRISAIFKPNDEEAYAPNNPKKYVPTLTTTTTASDASSMTQELPEIKGIRSGVPPGKAGVREFAAYLLDIDHLAGVPPTALAYASHPNFHYRSSQVTFEKLGSFQMYCPHECTAEDISSSCFDVHQVHALAILDIRLANQDRHAGNLLVTKKTPAPSSYQLIPIDHGCCLPRVSCMDETNFTWLEWSQSKEPFGADVVKYIELLNSWNQMDMILLQLGEKHRLLLDEESFMTLHVCTWLLKECVLNRNMTAFDIGTLMCRDSTVLEEDNNTITNQMSKLEKALKECFVTKFPLSKLPSLATNRQEYETFVQQFLLQLTNILFN